jgi:hypothetical protein
VQSIPLVEVVQVPSPLQTCPVTVLPVQVVEPQETPLAYRRQAPAPLHAPSCPQLVAPSSSQVASGSMPSRTTPHWPSAPETLFAARHVMQVPVQAVLQHTPSTQLPLLHSFSPAQATPFVFLGEHTPVARSQ